MIYYFNKTKLLEIRFICLNAGVIIYFDISRDPAALAYAIKRSCENKADVVSQDEKESGLRATLNLGHTFGHVSSF